MTNPQQQQQKSFEEEIKHISDYLNALKSQDIIIVRLSKVEGFITDIKEAHNASLERIEERLKYWGEAIVDESSCLGHEEYARGYNDCMKELIEILKQERGEK